MDWLFVAIGGALGALSRYGVSLLCAGIRVLTLPVGTFAVNVIGCFVLGILTGIGQKCESLPPQLILMFGTGFCGAFTTFSTFSAETIKACEGGNVLQAAIYVAASLTLGFILFFLGKRLAMGA